MPQLRLVCALFVLWNGLLLAQSTTVPTDDRETIAALVQQIKALQQQTLELQERVKVLEASRVQLAGAPDGTPTQAQPAQTSATDAIADTHQDAPPDFHEVHGIQWKGFAEVDYKVLDQRQPELGTYGFVPGSAGNFYTGDFALFLSSRLTSHTSVLSEIVFEERSQQNYKIDLRRVLLKYDWNDRLKMSFGRYQSSLGYYNFAFQSATWLQTTADRPLIMEYASNGGLLPTQAIGVSVTGSIPSGKLGLNYIAEYGTNQSIRTDINGSGLMDDENIGNDVLIGFFVRPDAFPGLQIGGSFFHNKVTDLSDPLGPTQYRQMIINAHIVYSGHGLELLNEGFLLRHREIGGTDLFHMPAFYSQVSQRIGRLRPFVRYQYINANPGSSFEDVLLRHGPSFGSRYDFNDYIAFKAQLDHTLRKGLPDLNGLHLQLSGSF